MIGNTLRQARLAHGIGLREMAKELGHTPAYISDIERGTRRPTEAMLATLAPRLGLDFDELMCEAGRIGAEAEAYIKRVPESVRLMRVIARANLSSEDLEALIRRVEAIGMQ